jgi:hypothetical protein
MDQSNNALHANRFKYWSEQSPLKYQRRTDDTLNTNDSIRPIDYQP